MTKPSMHPEVTVVASTPDHAVGHRGPVALYVWRRETLPSAVAAFEESLRLAALDGGGTCVLFGAAEPQASFPSSEIRTTLARIFRHDSSIVASAFTFEGQGIRPTAARNVANAITILARQPFPHRFFSSLADAARWTLREASPRGVALPTEAALVDALQQLRASPCVAD